MNFYTAFFILVVFNIVSFTPPLPDVVFKTPGSEKQYSVLVGEGSHSSQGGELQAQWLLYPVL